LRHILADAHCQRSGLLHSTSSHQSVFTPQFVFNFWSNEVRVSYISEL
jgi:hypothetical protein